MLKLQVVYVGYRKALQELMRLKKTLVDPHDAPGMDIATYQKAQMRYRRDKEVLLRHEKEHHDKLNTGIQRATEVHEELFTGLLSTGIPLHSFISKQTSEPDVVCKIPLQEYLVTVKSCGSH
jgi:hypothetical protein